MFDRIRDELSCRRRYEVCPHNHKHWLNRAGRKPPARRDIQGLRAIAVGAVIADHIVKWPSGGFIGVDVFFVISGYLITGLLLREHERTGSISWTGFYRRRFKRIMPAAVVTLFATCLASWVILSAEKAQQVVGDAIWSLFFVGNWRFISEGTDYFQQGETPSPLQHFWSLSVEEQFYFVWPWLMLAIFLVCTRWLRWPDARGRVAAGVVVGAASVGSFAWAMHQTVNDSTVAYFSSFTRVWELGVGALLAIAAPLLRNVPPAGRVVLAYAGLAGIATSLFVISDDAGFPAPWAALPVIATALVLASGEAGPVPLTRPLTSGVANYFGDISYSLYLWHFPVAILLSSYLLTDTVGYVIVALGLTWVLAHLSYYVLEDPLRRVKWSEFGLGRAAATFVTAAAVVTAAILVPAVILAPPTGDPESASDLFKVPSSTSENTVGPCLGLMADTKDCEAIDTSTVYPAPENLSTDENIAYQCFIKYGVTTPNLCELGATPEDAKVHIAVLGDSHAAQWLPGLRLEAAKRNWMVTSVTGQGCVWSIAVTDCPALPKMVDAINADDYDLVLVSSARREKFPDTAPAEMAAGLRSIHHPVAVIADTPAVTEQTIQCLSRQTVKPTDDCSTSRDVAFEMPDYLVQAAQSLGDPVISMNEVLCPGDAPCPGIINNALVYRDDLAHLSDTFSSTTGPTLADMIAKVLPRGASS